jgi:hypothetical protein
LVSVIGAEEECNKVPDFCRKETGVKEVFTSFTIVLGEEGVGRSNKATFKEVFPSDNFSFS